MALGALVFATGAWAQSADMVLSNHVVNPDPVPAGGIATITITVRPRTPALVLKNSQGQLEVVDATGVAYDQVSAPPAGVPLVTASSDAGSSKDALKAALSLIRALPADLASSLASGQHSVHQSKY